MPEFKAVVYYGFTKEVELRAHGYLSAAVKATVKTDTEEVEGMEVEGVEVFASGDVPSVGKYFVPWPSMGPDIMVEDTG